MSAAALGLTVLLGACGSGSRPVRAPLAQPNIVSVPVPQVIRPLANPAPGRLTTALANIRQGFAGTVGIAVRSVDAGWTAEANGRQRLPQQSVSKLWVAITVMDLRDQGRLRLDDPVVVRPQDLTLFHQPIATLVKGDGYHTTVADLLSRALTHSDNTANDRLLTLVGGPPAVRAMIERKRLGDIRFGPGERLLQSYTAGLTWQPSYSKGNSFEIARSRLPMAEREAAMDRYVADPPDGAAALAIADALARLAKGELLSETSTQYLLDTMGHSVTGRARLRAVLPGGWSIEHKTGTGQELPGRNAGFNDVGLLTAPDGARYAVAVLIGDNHRPEHDRQLLIQSVANAVREYHDERGQGLAAR